MKKQTCFCDRIFSSLSDDRSLFGRVLLYCCDAIYQFNPSLFNTFFPGANQMFLSTPLLIGIVYPVAFITYMAVLV